MQGRYGRMAWVMAGVASFALVGCQNKQPTQEVTELPPPPKVEPRPVELYEPVSTDVAVAPDDPFGATPMGAPTLGYGGGGEHIVRRGDTLWSIAATRLGDGQRWRDIVNANPGLEPTRMAVGQRITLP